MEDTLLRRIASFQLDKNLIQEIQEEEECTPFCTCGSPLVPRKIEEDFIWHPSNRF